MTTTFYPNTKAYIYYLAGNDWRGQPRYASKKPMRCSVIDFKISQSDVSIRADRSVSKGRAEEMTGKIRILTPPKLKVSNGDKIKLHNETLRVVTVFPRHSLDGKLHHNQVDLELWQEE